MKRGSLGVSVPNPGRWVLALLLVVVPTYLSNLIAAIVWKSDGGEQVLAFPYSIMNEDSVVWPRAWLNFSKFFGSIDLTWDLLKTFVLLFSFLAVSILTPLLCSLVARGWHRKTKPIENAPGNTGPLRLEIEAAFSSLGLKQPPVRVLPDLFHLNAYMLLGMRGPILVVTSGLQYAAVNKNPLVARILTHEAAHVLNRDVRFFYLSRYAIIALFSSLVIPYVGMAIYESFEWFHSAGEKAELETAVALRWYFRSLLFLVGLTGITGIAYLATASQREVVADFVASLRFGPEWLTAQFNHWNKRTASLSATYHPSSHVRGSSVRTRMRLFIAAYGSLFAAGFLVCSVVLWGFGLIPTLRAFGSFFFTHLSFMFSSPDFEETLPGIVSTVCGLFGPFLIMNFLTIGGAYVLGSLVWSSFRFQSLLLKQRAVSRIGGAAQGALDGVVFGAGFTVAQMALDPEVLHFTHWEVGIQNFTALLGLVASFAFTGFLAYPLAHCQGSRGLSWWREKLGSILFAIGLGGLFLVAVGVCAVVFEMALDSNRGRTFSSVCNELGLSADWGFLCGAAIGFFLILIGILGSLLTGCILLGYLNRVVSEKWDANKTTPPPIGLES